MSDAARKKLPYLQFYPNDWRTDIALRRCSLAARGLWIEMLGLMHHSEPYGTLVEDDQKPMSNAELAMQIGVPPEVVPPLLAELEKRNIFSRDGRGRIYSRRMQRDQHLREVRAAAGSKGGKRTAKTKK